MADAVRVSPLRCAIPLQHQSFIVQERESAVPDVIVRPVNIQLPMFSSCHFSSHVLDHCLQPSHMRARRDQLGQTVEEAVS
eukprot:1114980-Rhodomonas_salina.1